MRIVMTGGGSGGHITPILAVAAELKRQKTPTELIYIGQKGDGLGDIAHDDPIFDQVYAVRAGKFRRYHGERLKQLLDIRTMLLNIRDVFFVLIGLYQSYKLLSRLRPDIIFIKGGFVGVPVGLAAAFLHIPFITHDSDPIPGLANRIIGRWALVHAVALPKETYSYPQEDTVTTGIPLVGNFIPLTKEKVQSYRKEIGIPSRAKMLFVIGGGLGSERINKAMLEAVPHLLAEFTDLRVIHVVGRTHETLMRDSYQQLLDDEQLSRLQVFGFMKDVYRYSGAADVVITRAGATNLAEFALQGKACIVIPSGVLTGGHQLKSAQLLEARSAAVILDENELAADSNRLTKQVSGLLTDDHLRRRLARQLSAFARPDATHDLAMLLLSHGLKQQKGRAKRPELHTS